MSLQKQPSPKISLSRDARKIMYVEQIFKRQEEKQKRKQFRQKHKNPDSATEESADKNEYLQDLRYSYNRPGDLMLERKRSIPEKGKVQFITEADFVENFGKPQWLELYQLAEISRNNETVTKNASQQLGEPHKNDEKKEMLKHLIERTKAEQASYEGSGQKVCKTTT